MTDKYKALREAAVKATPGPWRLGHAGRSCVLSGREHMHVCPDYRAGRPCRETRLTWHDSKDVSQVENGYMISLDTHGEYNDPDIDTQRYIAAASPDVIASLLSDLDAANARADRAVLSASLLSADLTEMARSCEMRDDEYPRKAIEREIKTLRVALEKVERERDAAIAERGAYCERVEDLLTEVKRLREASPPASELVGIRGCIDSAPSVLRADIALAIGWITRLDAARGGAK